jgi:hypothetical protein
MHTGPNWRWLFLKNIQLLGFDDNLFENFWSMNPESPPPFDNPFSENMQAIVEGNDVLSFVALL